MANYLSIAEAQAYFDVRLNTDDWDLASNNDRTAALTMATDAINQLNYRGDKTDEDQENEFPRDDDTTVPETIEKACTELILKYLEGVDPEQEFENLDIVRQEMSGLKATYTRDQVPPHILSGIISVTAWKYLLPYLRDGRTITTSRVS